MVDEKGSRPAKINLPHDTLSQILLDTIPDPFYVVDVSDFSILMANAAATKKQSLNGLTCYQLSHGRSAPCDGPDHPCPVQLILESKQPVMVEHQHVDAEGQLYPVEVYAHPILDENGDVVQIVEYTRNISKQQQAIDETQALLTSSRAILQYREFGQAVRAICDSAKQITGAKVGYITLLNTDESVCEILLPATGERLFVNYNKMAASLRNILQDIYRTNEAIFYNSRIPLPPVKDLREKAGKSSNLLITPLLVGDIAVGTLNLMDKPAGFTQQDAHIAAAFGEMASIALLNNRAIDALSNNEQRFRSMVETANDAIIQTDGQGVIVDWNHAAEHILGYTPTEAIGMQINAILPRQFASMQMGPLQKALAKSRGDHVSATIEMMGVKRDGGHVPVEMSLAVWTMGGEDFYTVIMRDVSQRKRHETEQKELIRDLDAFAHMVAHDLKNPISLMGGYLDLLLDDTTAYEAGEKQDILQMMASSNRKMANIIDELLLLARLRKSEVTPHPFDMGHVVIEARQRLAFMESEYNGRIKQPDKWPQVMGYAPWIEEVWVNYISNALKYGGDPPEIALGYTELENGMVQFWVRDNGPGVDEDIRENLFRPFSRLDQVSAKGHGLGLSIVRRIVEKLGGQVAMKDASDRGSVFSFTLPMLE